MKAILQYSSTLNGLYKDAGTERVIRNLKYEVTPVNLKNRLDEPETVACKVTLVTPLLALNTDFLTQDNWYFRLQYLEELKEIKLGSRKYTTAYNGLIDRAKVQLHTVRLEFYIAISDYGTYTTPVDLPSGEESVFIETASYFVE